MDVHGYVHVSLGASESLASGLRRYGGTARAQEVIDLGSSSSSALPALDHAASHDQLSQDPVSL